MAASYPTSVKTFTTKVDVTDVNYAAHVNDLQDEVRAIELELGTLPKGGFSDVKARIANLETTKLNTSDIGTISHNALANLTVGDPHTQYALRSLWSAKGTLMSASAAGTLQALGVGANNTILEADSTQATGLKWGTAPIKVSVGTTAGDHLVFDGTNWVRLAVGADGEILTVDTSLGSKLKYTYAKPDQTKEWEYSGNLAVVTGKGRYRFPWAVTILGIAATVNTAPTGASVIVDVNKIASPGSGAASTIYSTQGNRPTIAIGAYDSGETTPNTTSFAAGDHMTVDIDQIGSTVTGADLTVIVRFKRT